MGLGDALIATGQVRALYAAKPVPVHVVGTGNRPQWSPVFEHNPKIARARSAPFQMLQNGPNIRPYIAGKTAARWHWREFQPEPGELYLTVQEKEFAAPYSGMVMIEPNVKANGHANKAWPFDRWQALVDRSDPGIFVQCGPVGSKWLDGVTRAVTDTFRQACAVLGASRAFVGTEGGLHHAAAALGVPAVVLWAEFIAPEVTGYASQRNIRHAGAACGSRVPCGPCLESMLAISVDEVAAALWDQFR